MLKIYLASIVIWMIINYSMVTLFGPRIKANGWVDERGTVIGKWKALFVGSAIPLVRLLVFSCFILMSIYTKEQFDTDFKKRLDDMGACNND